MSSSLGTAVVTGAARGIGRGIVERLADDGYRIVAMDRLEAVHDVADGLRAAGADTLLVEPHDERTQAARLQGLLGYEPQLTVACQPAQGRWDLTASELLADWCLEVAEQLPGNVPVLAWALDDEAARSAAELPNVVAVCRSLAEVVSAVQQMT